MSARPYPTLNEAQTKVKEARDLIARGRTNDDARLIEQGYDNLREAEQMLADARYADAHPDEVAQSEDERMRSGTTRFFFGNRRR